MADGGAMPRVAVSPSRLVCEAFGIEPLAADTAQQPATCAMCGSPIAPGEPCEVDPFRPSFTAIAEIDPRDGIVICAWCYAVFEGSPGSRPVRYRANRAAVWRGGAVDVKRRGALRAVIESPPEPPYLVVRYAESAKGYNRHLVFRAPVNLSRDLVQIRTESRVHTIRRPVWMACMDRLAGLRGRDRERAIQAALGGAHGPDGPLAGMADTLTPGERWALRLCGAVAPEEPGRLV